MGTSRTLVQVNTKRVMVGTVSVLGLALLVSGCAPSPDTAERATAAPSACVVRPGSALAPESGVLSGVNLDWGNESLQEFSGNLGRRPAVAVSFGQAPRKPVAIPETAALFVPSAGAGNELEIKQAWWRQLFDPQIPKDYPQLKMINWFEWNKQEVEVKAAVDWRSVGTPGIAEAYIADLPGWFRFAEEPAACTPGA
jgi:hypothetical protein